MPFIAAKSSGVSPFLSASFTAARLSAKAFVASRLPHAAHEWSGVESSPFLMSTHIPLPSKILIISTLPKIAPKLGAVSFMTFRILTSTLLSTRSIRIHNFIQHFPNICNIHIKCTFQIKLSLHAANFTQQYCSEQCYSTVSWDCKCPLKV